MSWHPKVSTVVYIVSASFGGQDVADFCAARRHRDEDVHKSSAATGRTGRQGFEATQKMRSFPTLDGQALQ